MTATAKKLVDPGLSIIARPAVTLPIFTTTSHDAIAVRGKTIVNLAGEEIAFDPSTIVDLDAPLVVGADYSIYVDATNRLVVVDAGKASDAPLLGGFHYAPGGNAAARQGGDTTPAINPFSIWDREFRPACADPRGMALVVGAPVLAGLPAFWVDIYPLNVEHLQLGTSAFGVEMADGYRQKPKGADGKLVDKLDYATAKAIVEGHGKQLLSVFEFFAAAYGVTEKTAAGSKPKLTGLDAPRTSRFGVMQATGNICVWGHDGDPDGPRASFFGGNWGYGSWAGSRLADVGDWPVNSYEWVGARGRSDHLQPDA